MNLEDLKKPFPKEKIHWRIGSTNKKAEQRRTGNQNAKATKGIPLAYIDARDVMQRLDEVCGMANWQCRYPFPGCCEIGIWVPNTVTQIDGATYTSPEGRWIWKSNGAGATDVEGEKGQYSDAFKRAGVLFGIGQYLYDLKNEWVDLDEWGKPKKGWPNLPNWALPGAKISQEVVRDFVKQVTEALEKGDDTEVRSLWSEWTDAEEKQYLWGRFNSQQRRLMKEIGA